MVAVAVVDLLEVIEIHDHQRQLGLEPLGTRELAREMHEQEARVRKPGQRIGQRVFLRLLEQHRVVDDGRGLLGDAIEETAVIVPIERRGEVIHRERADEALVEQQRADQRRLQLRAGAKTRLPRDRRSAAR